MPSITPQRTCVSHAAADGSDFKVGLRPYFAYRDLGFKEATSGAYVAHVIRALPGKKAEPEWHTHETSFQMIFVLRGWIDFEFEDIGITRLTAGSSCVFPSGVRHQVLANSSDFEQLEIVSPADFETHAADKP
ncbi:cupin domain-containing protein [Caballeronia sp. NCTM1]|uniref:cupin domain-containing protein n=1 Tax=Caballeronia sp. NCTM1 TaxID=2921753 RepID=UPI0020290290|nr:cupin domain-containing protein [Caballeronia sp. NCTM1]